jgi:general secretion pathway protein B
MSFILDALRKSEHERQRQTGPALVEVAVAAPKATTNRWATVAIALLLVNLVAIGVVLLFKSRDLPATAATAGQTRDNAASVATPPAGRAAATAPQATVTQTLPEPRIAPAPPPSLPRVEAPAQGTRNSLQQEMSDYAAPADHAAAAAAPPPGPGAVTTSRPGTVVYQSLPEADPGTSYRQPQAAAPSNLPTADELTARGSLPELRLELHVWSNKPPERFVFVNGRRYREGETTAEGATLEEITRDGVVMSAGGNRFLLSRD